MSQINSMIESRLRTVRNDARMRPIIDQVTAAGKRAHPTSDALLVVAARAARDQYQTASDAEIRERAFLAAAVSATESSVALNDLPTGTDKTQHFFMSGVISVAIARTADVVLPRVVAEKIGIAGSIALGWMKEVHDKFFGTGYNADDLKADVLGARRPFTVAVPR